MATAAEILRQVKTVARHKYAWPGGYPMCVVMRDGAILCATCARSEFRNIAHSTIRGYRDGWHAECSDINWEDTDLMCDHCNARIESAYGED